MKAGQQLTELVAAQNVFRPWTSWASASPRFVGGVHINSGIHNKAAFLMLTATNGGNQTLTPTEVAADST
jgi:Zn-dependent metalloprotease